MQLLKISEATAARRRIPVKLVDATDGKTEEPGLSGTATVTVSKNGAAYASAAGTFAEVGSGSYYYQATQGELDTPGFLLVRVTDAAARTFDASVEVIAFDPHDAAGLGLSRLDVVLSTLATASALAAVATSASSVDGKLTTARAGYLDNLSAGAVSQASALVTAQTDLTTLTGRLTAPRATALDSIDATISSRASAANMATAIAGIAAVEADTQDLQARLPAALVSGRIDASVGAMAAGVVTSTALDATAATKIATAVGAPSAATISAQVATDLATAHGAGSWEGASSGGATASEIADAVLDEALAGHATAGTLGAALTSLLSGVAALPSAATTAAAAASAVWAAVAEGGHTFGDYFRIAVAALVGRHTGTTGTNVIYSPVSTSTPRVTATVASDGTRGNPTIDGD